MPILTFACDLCGQIFNTAERALTFEGQETICEGCIAVKIVDGGDGG